MSKVLADVRVVEHGTFITGPAASMLLADLGADVVKVELPGTGDPFRAFKDGLYSPHFQTYNRNKRSITLNTKQAADLAQFDALIHIDETHALEPLDRGPVWHTGEAPETFPSGM